MATYLILNAVVLLVILVKRIVLLRATKVDYQRMLLAGMVLLVMTAVFDNLIIWSGIVAYDPVRYLGIHIGLAPIEDFAYSIGAVLLIPVLWKITKGKS